MADTLRDRAVDQIGRCNNADALKRYAANAAAVSDHGLVELALRRLYTIMPGATSGTFEHDVWQSIHGLEDSLSRERGRTTRLSRTRQKITRDGEAKTVADLVLGKPSGGFALLIERGLRELTFEEVALRHRSLFDDQVLASAEKRLSELDTDEGDTSPNIPPIGIERL